MASARLRAVPFSPGSGNQDHIKENVTLFDFALTDEEMSKLRALNEDAARAVCRAGLTEDKIRELLVLDVREQEYFTAKGVSGQHMGDMMFANEETMMNWLFSQSRKAGRTETNEKETDRYAVGDSDGF